MSGRVKQVYQEGGNHGANQTDSVRRHVVHGMTNVLVTGAGGAAGIAVIRALVERGQRVIAADSDPLAAGLRLADKRAMLGPPTEPDRFVEELAIVAARNDVDLVVCTVSEEMLVLAGREHELGAALWLPKRRSVVACVDKWRFWKIAEYAHIPAAPSALGDAAVDSITDSLPGPWIVKPRFGRGSRDVYAVDEPTELARACRRIDQPIVQTRLRGREFTLDLLVDREGRIAAAVPQWRLETRAGISTKGRTFRDHRLTEIAERVVAAYSLTGAANLQGFVTDEDDIVVIEVNPGFSGGLSLSLAAGADLVGEFVRGTLGLNLRPEQLEFRPGVTMVRHYTELFAA
jgi:carbamoyl-phosphate synthase large subunit